MTVPLWPNVLGVLLFFVALGFVDHAAFRSRQSGWRSLACRYAFEGHFEGKKWRFPDVSFRKSRAWTGYGVTLVLGANSHGLYMSQVGPFRLAHSALLVPWADIRFSDPTRRLWGRRISIFLGPDPSIELSAGGRLVDRLLEYRLKTNAAA